ncbi:MAG: hypothetical protein RLZZ490_1312 [Cyanobacteriota bacterium]
MIRQLNVFGTFLAFALTLAITQNIPTQIARLPDQSVVIAQQSKHRAKLRILRSWHGLIVRQHRSSGQPLGSFSSVKLNLHHP